MEKKLDWTLVPVTSEYANFLWRKHVNVESKKKTPSATFQDFPGKLLWLFLDRLYGETSPMSGNPRELRCPGMKQGNHDRPMHVGIGLTMCSEGLFWRVSPSSFQISMFFFSVLRFDTRDTHTMSIVSDVCFMILPKASKSALFCLVHRDFTWSIGDVTPFCDALGLGGDSGVGAVHLAQTPGLPGLVDGSTSTHTMGLRQADL